MRSAAGIAIGLATLALLQGCGREGEPGVPGAAAPAAEASGSAAAPNDREKTRAIMREIFDAMRVALPASADLETFTKDRERIHTALASLAHNAAALEQHTLPKDAPMRFLARSVAHDAAEVRRAYANGRHERAAFLLRQITENCVACHTRLPAEDSNVAEGFAEIGALESLPPEPRANLQIATRRFDDALTTLERLLADPDEHPALLIGPLTDYLVVSLRVKDDYERPVPTLQRFSRHTHLWERLALDVEAWAAALPLLHARTRGPASLELGRELVEEAQELSSQGDDLSGLVHFVAASSVLRRFLAEQGRIQLGTPEAARVGEAYYLLGTVEARIGRNYWVSEAQFLLERAIRVAPDQPFALEAFRRLESETLMQYEGADEEDLDPEDQRLIDELRTMVGADA